MGRVLWSIKAHYCEYISCRSSFRGHTGMEPPADKRMAAPFATPPDGSKAVVEQVSEQVAMRTQWSPRTALDNRCSQIRFLRSPQPPFRRSQFLRSQSEPEQLDFHLVRSGRPARRSRTCC